MVYVDSLIHHSDVIISATVSQITSLTIVCSTVYSVANQIKHQSSTSLASVRRIHRGPVNSPHKWPVTRKMFPFHDVIMLKSMLVNTNLQTLFLIGWQQIKSHVRKLSIYIDFYANFLLITPLLVDFNTGHSIIFQFYPPSKFQSDVNTLKPNFTLSKLGEIWW